MGLLIVEKSDIPLITFSLQSISCYFITIASLQVHRLVNLSYSKWVVCLLYCRRECKFGGLVISFIYSIWTLIRHRTRRSSFSQTDYIYRSTGFGKQYGFRFTKNDCPRQRCVYANLSIQSTFYFRFVDYFLCKHRASWFH